MERSLEGLIKNENMNDLNINNWAGKITHKNLEMSEKIHEFFRVDFKFPIKFVRGNVGNMEISIPWANLINGKVTVVIDDIFILAKLDLSSLEEYRKYKFLCSQRELLNEVEARIIDSFRKAQKVEVGYMNKFLDYMLTRIEFRVGKTQIRFEIVGLPQLESAWFLEFDGVAIESKPKTKTTPYSCSFTVVNLSIYDDLTDFLLKKYSDSDIKELDKDQFRELLANTKPKSEFMAPVNVYGLLMDEKDNKNHVLKTFEISPVHLTVDSRHLTIFYNFYYLYKYVEMYCHSKSLNLPFKIEDEALKLKFDSLRLNFLLNRFRSERGLSNKAFRRKVIDKYLERRWRYEFYYEVKMLHLMENECQIVDKKMYNLDSKIEGYNQEEMNVEEAIQMTVDFETKSECHDILKFRENVMAKLRNQLYLRNKLNQRLGYLNKLAEKNRGIGNLISGGVGMLFSVGRKKENMDDFVRKTSREMEKAEDISTTTEKFTMSYKFPAVKMDIVREQFVVMSIGIKQMSYVYTIDYKDLKSVLDFKAEKFDIESESGCKYLQILTEAGIPSFSLCMKSNVKGEKKNLSEEMAYTEKVESCKIAIGRVYSKVTPALISNFLYMFMRIPGMKDYSIKYDNLSDEFVSKDDSFVKTLYDYGKEYQSLSVSIESFDLLITSVEEKKAIKIKCKPHFTLENSEYCFSVQSADVRYGDLIFIVNNFEKQNLTGAFDNFTKMISPLDYEITALPRSKFRVSINFKIQNLDIFISEGFLSHTLLVLYDYLSIKLLNIDELVLSILKDRESKKSKKKKKMFTSKLNSQLMSTILRKRSTAQSKITSIMSSRKKSEGTNYYSVESEFGDEENDKFFEAFEDEGELICYNELQKTAKIFEGANRVFSDNMEVIEEIEVSKIKKNTKETIEGQSQQISISFSFTMNRLVFFLFDDYDISKGCSLAFRNLKIFKDEIQSTAQLERVNFVIKQNLSPICSKLYEILLDFYHKERVQEYFDGGSKANKSQVKENKNKHSESSFSSIKSLLDMNKIDFTFLVTDRVNIFIAEHTIDYLQPSALIEIFPGIKLDSKAQKLSLTFASTFQIFNSDIYHYEPVIEEFRSKIDFSISKEFFLKTEVMIKKFMVNFKPSLITNMLDTLSLFSTNSLKLSAEKNSILRIENLTGIEVDCSILNTVTYSRIRAYESKELNLIVLPKSKDTKLPNKGIQFDHSRLNELLEKEIDILYKKDLNEKGDLPVPPKKAAAHMFSLKKISLSFPMFKKNQIIDLKNISDFYIHVCNSQAIKVTMTIQGAKTIIRLHSNYRFDNSLDHPIEYQIYRQDDDMNLNLTEKNEMMSPKKRSSSIIFSDTEEDLGQETKSVIQERALSTTSGGGGDNSAKKVSKKKSFVFKKSRSKKTKNKSRLVYSFVLGPNEDKRLPILPNFPEDYYFEIRPASAAIFESVSSKPQKEFNLIKKQPGDVLNKFRVSVEDLFWSTSTVIKYNLSYSDHEEMKLSVHLGRALVKGGEEQETDLATPLEDNHTITSNGMGGECYCEFTVSVNYPIKITNCLPMDLNYKFLDLDMIPGLGTREDISIVALSNYGSRTIAEWMKSSDIGGYDGLLNHAAVENLLNITPQEYPLLSVESRTTGGRGILKLKRILRKAERKSLGSSSNISSEKREDNPVWHENRIVHLYNPDTRRYTNFFVQTSKIYDILRLSISAQFLILNESSNILDLIIEENGFCYEPIKLSPCNPELLKSLQKSSSNLDKSNMKSFLLMENIVMDRNTLEKMVSAQEFSAFSKIGNGLLKQRAKYIKTFTGDASSLSKKIKVKLKDKLSREIDTEELLKSGSRLNLAFRSKFKGSYKKEVCLGIRSYQLSDEFGAAQLIVIGPSYILVNQTDQDLRITHLPGSKNSTVLLKDEMVKLDFRADSEGKINKLIYLNCAQDGYLWSAGLKVEREDLSGFELKCVSLKRDSPKVFRVDVENKGVSLIFRVTASPPERMKILNKTSHTFKINQAGFEQYGEFIGPEGEEIGFFWDDPFAKNVLQFERLFNNRNSTQCFELLLEDVTQKKTLIIDLNKGVSNKKKSTKYLTDNLIDVTVDKAYSGDGLMITISSVVESKNQHKRIFQMFPRTQDESPSKNFLDRQSSNEVEFLLTLNYLGLSFSDEKPREVFFFTVDNLRLRALFDACSYTLSQLYLDVMDIQGDYQISKSLNKVMIMTKRQVKKKRFTEIFIENQLNPFFRLDSNFTYKNGKIKLITVDVDLCLLILRLNGKSFSRLYRLMNQLTQLYEQSSALLMPPPQQDASPMFQGYQPPKSSFESGGLITLRMSELNADLIFENVPELIGTFSQSHVSRILSMLLKNISSFNVRYSALSLERRNVTDETYNHIMKHYISQTGLQFFKTFTNNEVFGNPSKMISRLSETFYNFVTISKNSGGNTSQKDARDAFLTVFDAYSQVSGNFHHTVLRKFFNEKDLQKWYLLVKIKSKIFFKFFFNFSNFFS